MVKPACETLWVSCLLEWWLDFPPEPILVIYEILQMSVSVYPPVLCHQCIRIKSLISHNDKSNVHPFCSCIFAPDIVTSVFFPSLFLSLKNPLCFDPLCGFFVFYLIIFHCGRGGNVGISWLSPRDSRQRGSAGQGAGEVERAGPSALPGPRGCFSVFMLPVSSGLFDGSLSCFITNAAESTP